MSDKEKFFQATSNAFDVQAVPVTNASVIGHNALQSNSLMTLNDSNASSTNSLGLAHNNAAPYSGAYQPNPLAMSTSASMPISIGNAPYKNQQQIMLMDAWKSYSILNPHPFMDFKASLNANTAPVTNTSNSHSFKSQQTSQGFPLNHPFHNNSNTSNISNPPHPIHQLHHFSHQHSNTQLTSSHSSLLNSNAPSKLNSSTSLNFTNETSSSMNNQPLAQNMIRNSSTATLSFRPIAASAEPFRINESPYLMDTNANSVSVSGSNKISGQGTTNHSSNGSKVMHPDNDDEGIDSTGIQKHIHSTLAELGLTDEEEIKANVVDFTKGNHVQTNAVETDLKSFMLHPGAANANNNLMHGIGLLPNRSNSNNDLSLGLSLSGLPNMNAAGMVNTIGGAASLMNFPHGASAMISPKRHHHRSVPSAGYICRLCLIEGHWMEDCVLYEGKQPDLLNGGSLVTSGLFNAKKAQKQLTQQLFTPQQIQQQHIQQHQLQYSQKEIPYYKRRPVPPADYICKSCNVAGHWLQNCAFKPVIPPAYYTCHICQIKGHWIESCPEIAKRNIDVSYFNY